MSACQPSTCQAGHAQLPNCNALGVKAFLPDTTPTSPHARHILDLLTYTRKNSLPWSLVSCAFDTEGSAVASTVMMASTLMALGSASTALDFAQCIAPAPALGWKSVQTARRRGAAAGLVLERSLR